MTDLFLSYSRADSEFVQQLVTGLTAVPLDVWVDTEDIPYSVDWWQRICKGIDEANNVVIVLTEDWLASEVCHAEYEYARSRNKRVIPVLVHPFDEAVRAAKLAERRWERADKLLAEEQWVYLRRLNWINFATAPFATRLMQLVSTAREDIAHKDRHTELLNRALQWQERKDPAYLLTGAALRDAEHWQAAASGKVPAPVPLHQDYIAASTAAQQKRQRRTVQVSAAGALLALVLVGLAVFAFRRASEESANRAVLNAAGQSQIALESGSAETAALLAVRALRSGYDASADAALTRAGQELSTVAFYEAAEVHFSPDGELALVAGRVVRWRTGEVVLDLGSASRHVFTPHGGLIVVSGPSTIRVFDPAMQPVTEFTGDSDRVIRLALLGDNVFATGNAQSALYDPATGTLLRAWPARWNAAVSPDGQRAILYPETPLEAFTPTPFPTAPLDPTYAAIMAPVQTANAPRRSQTETAAALQPDLATQQAAPLMTLAALQRMIGGTQPTPSFNANSAPPLPLIDTRTGETLAELLLNNAALESVYFAPDGDTVLAGYVDGTPEATAALWSLATGERLRLFPAASPGGVFRALFSPDGSRILTMGYDQRTLLWDAQAAEPLAEFRVSITKFTFTPDGCCVIGYEGGGAVSRWNAADGSLMQTYGTSAHRPSNFDISPDGRWVAVGGATPFIRVFSYDTGALVRTTGGTSVQFSPDSTLLAVGERAGETDIVRIVSAAGAALPPPLALEQSARLLGWTDTAFVALGADQGAAWTPDGLPLSRFTHSASLASIGLADNTLVLQRGSYLDVWDITTGTLRHQISIPSSRLDFKLSADASSIYASYWPLPTATPFARVLMPTQPAFSYLEPTPSSFEALYNYNRQQRTAYFDTRTGQQSNQANSPYSVIGTGYQVSTADEAYSLSRHVSGDGTVGWVNASREIIHDWSISGVHAASVALSPDAALALVGYADGSARLYETGSGALRRVFTGQTAESITALAFSLDGAWIATGASDGSIWLRPTEISALIGLVCARLPRDLTAAERAQFSQDDTPTCPPPTTAP